ncbi:MAG TPA: nuclear transport factor 2 family protein, partial [Polyangiaceae bacterium]|nr:nuclear transport factor 2 family protein [Polyangiaceae bacterium]
MKKILCSVALLALAACGQQKPAETAAAPAAPPPAAEPAPAPAPAPVAEKKAEPLPPLPPAERAKWYQDCWAAFNVKDWAKFDACWADDATAEQVDSGMPMSKGKKDVLDKGAKQFAASFPDATGEHELTLVNGNSIVSIVLVRGTNKGPLPTPMGELPATNKKIGMLVGHVIDSTADGRKAQAERFYADAGSQMGQLGMNPAPHRKLVEVGWPKKEVVIAAGNDVEKANLEIAKKQV